MLLVDQLNLMRPCGGQFGLSLQLIKYVTWSIVVHFGSLSSRHCCADAKRTTKLVRFMLFVNLSLILL